MANFEGDGFRGNFGFRYIGTEAESQYHAFDGVSNPNGDANGAEGVKFYANGKSTNTASYNDVLPSANVIFDLSDDVILRTSISQVISRPNYANMFAQSSQSGYADEIGGNETFTQGNIGLAPTKATQADAGVEWYYGEGNMVSATYFIQDFSSFVTESLVNDQQVGIVDPVSGVDNWTLSSFENASGGRIEGLELQLQHSLDSGFGIATNYTYVDAGSPAKFYADRIGVFSDSSEHTINAVGFWENDTFSARAAYNWRSEYMIRESGFYGNRMHNDYGTLDLSFGWTITDNLGVSFEIANVLEEDSVQTGEASATDPEVSVKSDLRGGHPAWSYDGEARYKLGVNYSF
jgi:iron complex outermembrane receptor protein